MTYRDRAGRLLIGSNASGALLVVGGAILVGVCTWLVYPVLGVEYWVRPTSLAEWVLLGGFLLVPAGVAVIRGGLLAALWVNIPAHVVIGFYYFIDQSGRIVVFGYTGSRSVDIIVVSGVIAVLYGATGYLLGSVIWWSTRWSPLTPESAQ